jgi:1,2-phenylacetyl-CoA epoxidase PaaB subunit
MWVVVKMIKNHSGIQLPVILVDSHSEIMSFESEEEALKIKELFEVNSDSGHKYLVKKH